LQDLFFFILCNVHLTELCTNSSFHHIMQVPWCIYSKWA